MDEIDIYVILQSPEVGMAPKEISKIHYKNKNPNLHTDGQNFRYVISLGMRM